MFLGTQYYRPPNPRREDWDRDLARIKEHGLELIRTWVYWSRVNPRRERWAWDEYDQLLGLAEKHGLEVFLQLMCDAPPYWLQDSYPEALYVDAEGRRVEFTAHGAQAVGGVPGPCFHRPEARRAAEEYMRRTAERYRAAPALYGYDVWNEVWMRECFCEHTTRLWQGWLKRKYDDVKGLNKVWQRSYGDFSEVRLPKSGVYVEMFDRYEFEQWSRAELMRWRAEAVRAVDRAHPVFSHYIGYVPLVTPEHDAWLLSEPLDKWGTSCYDADLASAHLTMNAAACSAKGKPWWLSEQTGGRVWSGLPESRRNDAFLRSLHLLAMSLGAEASIIWQWRAEIFGQEAPNFGLTGLDGEPTTRSEDVKNLAEMLRSHKAVFDEMKLEEPKVGLLWEPRSIMHEQVTHGPRKPGLWLGWENLTGYYRALLDRGYVVEVLNAREVAEGEVPKRLRLLIAPHSFIDRRGLCARLEAWVSAGGTLLAGPFFGVYDAKTYANKQCPPAEAMGLFAATQRDVYFPESLSVDLVQGELNAVGALPGFKLVEDLEPREAGAVGVYGEKVAITENQFGKGYALLMGSFFGAAYNRGSTPQLSSFLDQLGQRAQAAPRVRATQGCCTRTATADGGLVVFLTNPGKTPVTAWLTFPAEARGRLVSLLTGKEAGYVKQSQPTPIRLEAEDSTILLLE